MLRSIPFDIAFLGFGSALLVSTIDVHEGLFSLAIGVLAALARSVINDRPRARATVGLRAAAV